MNLCDLTILTVSFNNDLLTGMMLKSFAKQVGELPNVVIVDNGTMTPVNNDLKSIFTVVDNFQNKIAKQHLKSSSQHAWAIDYALKNCITTKYCLLVDNDILFKADVKDFILLYCTDAYDCYGEIGWDCTPPDRLYPYFCMINVQKFKSDDVNYYDENRINKDHQNRYDTGYSFYMDIKDKWNIKNIKLNRFIIHYKSATLANKNTAIFLKNNRELF